uniref:60S ribosomal protein L12 n=1 Tax=Paramoeba aestuarina TaxID=180227 RepID=A0A7S4NT06_9EUKA|mmetsp:Transcript_27109/g.42170  ORF Transcript_27109/g.42170 Transcript_27109/m.42170 type:complete len:167 (+) Transcript_27109:140-640(+)|eukprot:CAMPEP_0201518278 /NCGR_PEP_ID=MMETSP0161_2-20130828/9155_1 /ASSEMBLY_ACC=CAM_ASM_000251 /TAXON_ID=180227 /ORGANISM="Neoparamoeba aestuarina, Strain SoJaBio B1-5/56/2" /LENGTH=166 /DNA_ID=CAMNT_0047916015 /DNA_START=139 /DNA_END=639 /DNA_ORIENTATION=-
MPPKFDPNEVKILYLRVVGGVVGAASSLAPKIGPLGLSPKKVGDDIAKATKDWKGLRITVKLEIKNRQAAVSVEPTASALIVRALKEPPKEKKVKNTPYFHHGNITFNDVVEVARVMRYKSMAKEFSGTVKEILGTACSVGCTVDKKNPKEIQAMIDSGELEVPAE